MTSLSVPYAGQHDAPVPNRSAQFAHGQVVHPSPGAYVVQVPAVHASLSAH
jgi:hypothetical protein